MRKKEMRAIPRFETEDAEREFWSAHDSADYVDWKRAQRVKRCDGQDFVIRPQVDRRSPLDVDGVDLQLSRDEIVRAVREGRRMHGTHV